MRRLGLSLMVGVLALGALAGTVNAGRSFGAAYSDDMVYRVFGNKANVPDGTGTDPFAIFTNATNPAQLGVAEFAPGQIGHHGGRWAVYRATWTASGDQSDVVTSWSELQARVAVGEIVLVRDEAADFRCPVLGNGQPI